MRIFSLSWKSFTLLHSVVHIKSDRNAKGKIELEREDQNLSLFLTSAKLTSHSTEVGVRLSDCRF